MTNLSLFPEPTEPSEKHYTVREVTLQMQRLIDQHLPFRDLWVEGEVSNYKRNKSGHVYFTLKDEASQLKCVMFKSKASRQSYEPNHGDKVQVHGYISVYEAGGDYQLYADAIQPLGVGDLHQRFEMLKAKLDAEGLFDSSHKRPLPLFPKTIGIVTSPTTAAFQDVLNVFRRRFPLAHIILSPAQVQGETAAPEIIAALNKLNRRDDIDVILLIRGGGSLEDLWCFNDERLVREVANSRLPIVTGVGHEIDFTLVDFASDFRAPTPSAAAEIVTPHRDTLESQVDTLRQYIANAVTTLFDDQKQRVQIQKRALRHLSPENKIRQLLQRLDDLQTRLGRAIQSQLGTTQQKLRAQIVGLRANSPHAILARGYAIVTRAGDGKQINNALEAAQGTLIHIQLHQGTLKATVKERTLDDSTSS